MMGTGNQSSLGASKVSFTKYSNGGGAVLGSTCTAHIHLPFSDYIMSTEAGAVKLQVYKQLVAFNCRSSRRLLFIEMPESNRTDP